MPPYRTQFFHFRTHFHLKVPTSEAKTSPKWVHTPPTGNPGSGPGIGIDKDKCQLGNVTMEQEAYPCIEKCDQMPEVRKFCHLKY